jgi:hypothetical protein
VPPAPGCPETGPPSPEVTEAFCRVPSTQFSQAPWYALPVHLCRFRVRSDGGLFPGTASKPPQSDKGRQQPRSVTSSWPGNINPVPIDYAFRPRLRGRLTLLRLALSRNPWTFGEGVSHSLYRYSCQHSRFRSLHRMPHGPASQKAPLPAHLPIAEEVNRRDARSRNAPLPRAPKCTPRASAHGLSPVTSSPQDSLTRPVSCYAFFK